MIYFNKQKRFKMDNLSPVEVYNEWDPLEEIIVGSAQYAQMPNKDNSISAVGEAAGDMFDSLHRGRFPERIVEETEEDIALFIHELEKLDITVKRPKPIDLKETFKTPFWEAGYYFSYCPRDILLAIGDMLIETPNVFRSRYFESFAYKDILLHYMKKGAKWISAPKPCLTDELYNTSDSNAPVLGNIEPVFDAANVIRAGRDLFYQISDSGNELGCQWLQTILGEKYRVHPCRNLYPSIHIDSTLSLLRPGLVLVNPTRVNEDNLPDLLKGWDVIEAPEMEVKNYSELKPISSPWLGMNLLMINPNLAVVDAHQKKLIQLLHKHKIDVIPLVLRHGRTLAGGFHCITLDIRRKGTFEEYF